MTLNWRDQIIEQLDFYRRHHLEPRLEGLTDAEYHWEPVDGCWGVRPGDNGFTIDWQWPAPEPPPVTTIAWRMAHLSVLVFGMRYRMFFGDGTFDIDAVDWPGDADSGVELLRDNITAWRDAIAALDPPALAAPVGERQPGWESHPLGELVLHLNRECMHHGAEIALLRDLFRARFDASDAVEPGPPSGTASRS